MTETTPRYAFMMTVFDRAGAVISVTNAEFDAERFGVKALYVIGKDLRVPMAASVVAYDRKQFRWFTVLPYTTFDLCDVDVRPGDSLELFCELDLYDGNGK